MKMLIKLGCLATTVATLLCTTNARTASSAPSAQEGKKQFDVHRLQHELETRPRQRPAFMTPAPGPEPAPSPMHEAWHAFIQTQERQPAPVPAGIYPNEIQDAIDQNRLTGDMVIDAADRGLINEAQANTLFDMITGQAPMQ